jgi:hypothetical protein
MYRKPHAKGIGNFQDAGLKDHFTYWASSQQTATMSVYVDFADNGRVHGDDKDFPRRVRTIRTLQRRPPSLRVSRPRCRGLMDPPQTGTADCAPRRTCISGSTFSKSPRGLALCEQRSLLSPVCTVEPLAR